MRTATALLLCAKSRSAAFKRRAAPSRRPPRLRRPNTSGRVGSLSSDRPAGARLQGREGEMRNRTAMVIALVAAVAVVVFGAQSATAAQQTPQDQQISLLFAQTANRGQMTPIKGTPRFHLKLFGVHPQVVWFSDRPARESGTIPVRRFALSWAGFGFLDEPPNAALTVLHTGKRHDT